MRFEKGTGGPTGHSSGTGVEGRASVVTLCAEIRIPLRIDDEIMVRSLSAPAHRTMSSIVGAWPGRFILIREPVVVINNRITAVFDNAFECSYFSGECRYNFLSKYKNHVLEDVICIEYPSKVDVRRIRKHRRIKVNIETRYAVLGVPKWFSADMTDISQAGCCLVVEPGASIPKGTKVLMEFGLPNENTENEFRAVVVRSKPVMNGEKTELGLTFTGPQGGLARISNFCEFCMFFELE